MRLILPMICLTCLYGSIDDMVRSDSPVAISGAHNSYVKCGLIGSGTDSDVYEAVQVPMGVQSDSCDSLIGPHVALKCSVCGEEDGTSTFRKQAAAMSLFGGYSWNLNFVDYFVSPGGLECLALEMGGASVDSLVSAELLDQPTRTAVVHRMIEVIAELHAIGFSHGDLTLNNWVMGIDAGVESLKLIDFEFLTPLDPDTARDDYVGLLHCIEELILSGSTEWPSIRDLFQSNWNFHIY